MDFSNKKIGIWGYGVVGKSLVRYLCSKNVKLSVLEKQRIDLSELSFLSNQNVTVYEQNCNSIKYFLEQNDFIIPSPGINVDLYTDFKCKFLWELDIFKMQCGKPIVAVTGTIGKTTITTLLNEVLQKAGRKSIAAGNIGLGMCDLLTLHDQYDCIFLELSSYQLEKSTRFSPDLSIWTNFFPNHLDWHSNIDNYFNAKLKICLTQTNNQNALLPFEIATKLPKLNCKKSFFSLERPNASEIKQIQDFHCLFFIENNEIKVMNDNFCTEILASLNIFSDVTYIQNWLILTAALYLQNININSIELPDSLVFEHRFENFLTCNNISFYNDSKSTIPESTLAAVSKLNRDNIILLLGGLSKGVDRSILVSQLKGKVKSIICFGNEADNLKKICNLNNINSFNFASLEEGVNKTIEIAKEGDAILFSPAGSSFDLFSDYKDRGKRFKELVVKKLTR